MANNPQFKINQIAKDLGKKSKDIVEILAQNGIDAKTSQKTLEAEEFDLFFDTITKQNQITEIENYIDGITYIPTKKKEEEKPEVKAEVKPEAKAEPKAEAKPAAPAPEAKKPVEKKAEEKPEVKAEKKVEAPKPAPEKKPEPAKEEPKKAETKPVEAPKQKVEMKEDEKAVLDRLMKELDL